MERDVAHQVGDVDRSGPAIIAEPETSTLVSVERSPRSVQPDGCLLLCTKAALPGGLPA